MTLAISVLVCDDEAIARKRTMRLLAETGFADQLFEADSADAAMRILEREDIEVLILDIRMPGENGIEFASRLPMPRPFIVFLTAHAEHALEAFDVGAVDYLMKPLDSEKLQRSLSRATVGRAPTAKANAPADGGRFALRTREGAWLIRSTEITHAVFDGALVTVHLADGRHVLSDLTLADLESKVPSLERVHRRALLNLDHVRTLESLASGGYAAHTTSGAVVDVSRQSARDLRRRLGLS